MKKLFIILFIIFLNTVVAQDIINETGKDGKFIVRDIEQKEALIIEDSEVTIKGELKVEEFSEGKEGDMIVVWDENDKTLKVLPRIFSSRSPLSKPLISANEYRFDNDKYNKNPLQQNMFSVNAVEDIVHNDDVIIQGSLGVGFDAYSGYSFGFDTIVLMENNLRIYFDDTSNSALFPNNDWRIRINDTTNGGGEYFAIEDASAGRTPFLVSAGGPSNSLYIDAQGDVGFGTNNPVTELHSADGDTPALRLEQNGTSGWTPQTWDMAGNETNFFIRDVTNGSKLPFRIRPGAPTNTLYLMNDGNVGIGTPNPVDHLHVAGSGPQRIKISSTDDRAGFILDGNKAGNMWLVFNPKNNHDLHYFVYSSTYGNGTRMAIKANGNIGLGTNQPSERLELEFDADTEIELGQGNDPDVTFISLRSPNGTKYYVTVDNSGNLVTSTTKP